MDDLDQLMTWQSHSHVSAWRDSDEPYDLEELSDPKVSRWIVSIEDRPFAYMQDYSVHGWDEHYFAHLPQGSRGIDQYIGEPDMLGKGHGTGFIATRINQLFAAGTPVIATDPHPDNAQAISVYARLGFEVFGGPQDTEWGLILPMITRWQDYR